MIEPRSAPEAVEAALAVVERYEPDVQAWVHLDPDRARKEAASAPAGPLAGVVLGVKDIMDTSDMPTEHGTPIYAGNRPSSDAACVAVLRARGATVLGKAVTTELASALPGPTRNPHRLTHTPGASSSGSAAAVAAGMADLTLGTQTAGSVIRPASFCGVWGYKPTYGIVPTAGVKQTCWSLDTVGLLAADLDVLDIGRTALTGQRPATDHPSVRFGVTRTDQWDWLDADGSAVVEAAAAAVGAAEVPFLDELVGLTARIGTITGFEGRRALAWEMEVHADLLSELRRTRLEDAASISPEEYEEVLEAMLRARRRDVADRVFGAADVLITACAAGEAPEGLGFTGDPRFCATWTMLGYPALSVPGMVGASGLPIGIQLVARPNCDGLLFPAARQVLAALGLPAEITPVRPGADGAPGA